LAHHQDIIVGVKKKIRYDPISLLARNVEMSYTNTDRTMVKINDKRALETYSEIEFQQMRKSYGYRTKSTFTSVVGVRVIKPDGKIVEVDATQSVATLDEKSDKQRKLAIPDLQVGDVLDFFYSDEYKMDDQDINSLTFFLFNHIPVLSYSVHCELGKNVRVEYRTYNNAPDFEVSSDAEKNQTLDLQVSDLQVYTDNLWINFIRSLPMIRMNIINEDNKLIARPRINTNLPGLMKNPPQSHVINDTKWSASIESYGYNNSQYAFKEVKKLLEKYKSNHPQATDDEISAFIYYAYRYYIHDAVESMDGVLVNNKRNYLRYNERVCVVALERLINKLNSKAAYELGFTAEKDYPPLDEIFTRHDADFTILKSTDPHKLLAFPTTFTNAWYIPAKYEGEKTAAFLIENYGKYQEGKVKAQDKGIIELPASKSIDNQSIVNINVSIDNSFSLLTLDRNVKLKGHLKAPFQQLLLLFEDYEAEERNYLGIEKSLKEELQAKGKLRKLIPDYEAAFAEARKEQKDYFTEEAKQLYGKNFKEMLEYKIINSGIFHDNPDFVFRSKFTEEGFLNKAGNDYILNAGMLIGDQLHLSEQQRKRQLDIYIPFARDYEYEIAIRIPEGYSVKNIESLNKDIRNSCGQFKSTAEYKENQLLIRVSKIFEKSYERLEKWPQLLEILDAATDFTGQNVIIGK
jgi:hypothetical protein